MEWIKGFFVPLIEVIVYLGFFGFISYVIGKAFWNLWSKKLKFVWKYKIKRKPYEEQKVQKIIECIDAGMKWSDFKKYLCLEMIEGSEYNEYLWIYEQIVKKLNQKGG